ncbi:MAG: Nif3-like dinuclear metal center hexameric protein [Deferribacteres bacterium]|nr:Nif3-like dinuclear metal center hexameric protein [Deferribacteres bacterium]
MKVSEVITLIDRYFPLSKALPWDNSGLQIGSWEKVVSRVLVCLDIDREVAKEASSFKADLIITHHPLFMKNVKCICPENNLGWIAAYLIKKNMALASFHTNVDVASGGLADYVGSLLGLSEMKPLTEEGLGRVGHLIQPTSVKTFVKKVKEALHIDQPVKVTAAGKKISTVAICPGSGGDLIDEAIRSGADCFVTGDIKYHQAFNSKGLITLIDAGHYHTELPFCSLIASILERETGLEVKISERQKNPFQCM